MDKLTTEQIECIDDRLYNLGMKYIDIRYEMVDHIASELEAMEGYFGTNCREYFLMNSNALLKQNKRARRAATLRAIKLYFTTMAIPFVFISAILFGTAAYFASFLAENEDVHFFGLCILFVMILPFYWVARGNREISVLRPMVLINSFLYIMYQWAAIIGYRIDDRALRVIPNRIAVAIVPALMLVLIISLYRCRKQYVGKYI